LRYHSARHVLNSVLTVLYRNVRVISDGKQNIRVVVSFTWIGLDVRGMDVRFAKGKCFSPFFTGSNPEFVRQYLIQEALCVKVKRLPSTASYITINCSFTSTIQGVMFSIWTTSRLLLHVYLMVIIKLSSETLQVQLLHEFGYSEFCTYPIIIELIFCRIIERETHIYIYIYIYIGRTRWPVV